MSDKVRVLRLIEYSGPRDAVMNTLKRSWPDGGPRCPGQTCIKVKTLEGEQATMLERHADWETNDPRVVPSLSGVVLSRDVFDEIREALDSYSDIIDGGDGTEQPLPNKAMRAMNRLHEEGLL